VKTIRVDDEVHQMILKLAMPYEDKEENDTLKRQLPRLLQNEPHTPPISPTLSTTVEIRRPSGMARSTRRPSNVGYTSQRSFWRPILEILEEMGGRAPIGEVLDRIPTKVTLTSGDFEKTNSGWILWQNRACWARQNMKDQGLLRSDSPRGVWEISDEGRRAMAENRV
jgi:hypothetical protein